MTDTSFGCDTGLQLISIRLALGSLQEAAQGLDSRYSEAARSGKLQLRGQLVESPAEGCHRVSMPDEPCVTAYLADGAEDRNRPKLLQKVRVAQQRALERFRPACRDMRPDGLNDCWNLGFWKTRSVQDLGCLAAGITHVVPGCQRSRVFRTMADEDPEIVQPGGSVKHVVIVGLTLGQPFRKLVKPGLMAELVRRLRLGADVVSDGLAVAGLGHGLRPVAASTART